jgi:serine/threonine-protein kinase
MEWSTLGPGQSLWDGRSPKRTARLVNGLAGRVVDGRYKLGQLIDDAALCATYDAYEIETGKHVAIELLSLPPGAGPPADAQFHRDARRVASATHPGLRVVRAIGIEAGAPYIVSEPVHGESLRDRLTRTGRMPSDESVDIALAIIDAVAAGHAAGLVHANLKPEKIRMSTREGAPLVTVMGLGVSTLLATLRDVDTRGVGTPPYLSPEQLSGSGAADELTDVWGIGLILFEMITGQRAFEGTTADEVGRRIAVEGAPKLRRVFPAAPAALERIVEATLARRREQRLSLRDLRRALCDLRDQRVRYRPPPLRHDALFDLTDPCEDDEGTTDLHLIIDTDLDGP